MAEAARREAVYARLKELGIPYEITEHPPVFTIDEMEALGIEWRGEVCKNLFLRDDKGKRHFLVALKRFKTADLKAMQEQIGSTRLGFASADRLERYLGLHKGEVSPMGLLNDTEHAVEVLFDQELEGLRVGVHPCDNTATVWLEFEDLKRMIEQGGHSVRLIKL